MRQITAEERMLQYLRGEIATRGADPLIDDIVDLLEIAQMKLAMWQDFQTESSLIATHNLLSHLNS